MPPLRFFRSQLAHRAAPAVTYYIRGKSTAASETFYLTYIMDGELTPEAPESVTVAVDGNGDWSFDYIGKKLYSISAFGNRNNTTCTMLDFSGADDFNSIVLDGLREAIRGFHALTTIDMSNAKAVNAKSIAYMFYQCENLTTISLNNATFDNVTDASVMCSGCSSLTTLNMSNATMQSVTNISSMFYNCIALVSMDLSQCQFKEVTTSSSMFYSCAALTAVDLRAATFEKTQSANNMFMFCPNLASVRLDAATFTMATNLTEMFRGCSALTSIDMPNADFSATTNLFRWLWQCHVVTLNIPSATMANVTNATNAFYQCWYLTTVNVPQNSTALGSVDVNLSACPLTYSSMVNIANWIKDLTGLSANTITYRLLAWNTLSAAEQATITGILNGKNWTLATANS